MIDQYGLIAHGFVDTLKIIKKVRNCNGKDENTLKNLANILNINCIDAHNAIVDVRMLEEVINKLFIKHEMLINECTRWDHVLSKNTLKKPDSFSIDCKILDPLKECTSLATRKMMMKSNITFSDVIDSYGSNKLKGIEDLFGETSEGFLRVSKSPNVINKVNKYLSDLYDILSLYDL
ncbi:hypothetical protein TKK_0008024 [Trichogramma kaykai]